MSRKVSIDAEVMLYVRVPVKAKLDITMRVEDDAPHYHYLERYVKSGRTAFPKGDIEDVQVELLELDKEFYPEDWESFNWGTIQDYIVEKMSADCIDLFQGNLVTATVSDSR